MINKKDISLYEGCGNRLLIVHLKDDFSIDDLHLRQDLSALGRQYNCDSVLVLGGNPVDLLKQGYHVSMDVFEPRGIDSQHPNLPGSWSTMCGNGVRAVTKYLIDKGELTCIVKTKSGLRSVNMLSGNLFRVCMGKLATSKKDLGKYIKNFNFYSLIPERKRIFIKDIIVGLNGDEDEMGLIDGEPHLLILLADKLYIKNLINYAEDFGPIFTKNRLYFPESINTNVISINNSNHEFIEVYSCTYERGVEYITKACGTGATVTGSYFLTRNPRIKYINVRMPGGILKIERGENENFYMTGSANRIE